jgi:hypothetical protein
MTMFLPNRVTESCEKEVCGGEEQLVAQIF